MSTPSVVSRGFRALADALLCGCLCICLLIAAMPVSAAESDTYKAPRWAFEFKGGQFKPDLEFYEDFYGSDKNTYFAIGGAYRFTNWLELGAEVGYSKDKGQGLLPNNGQLGGQVEYTLVPLTVFLNFRYDRTPNQLFVPYAGVGLATAWYRQKIDNQSDREGRSDVGGAARAGLQLLLNRIDTRGAATVSGGDRRFKAFLFLEGQVFKAEVDDIDLGGEIYLLGLRCEFD